ncbi:MAG: serine/threonine protein phosphatase, partial [Pseudomonadota bacterium]
ETLISYGVRPPRTRTQIDEWVEACEKLREVLPIEHRAFLSSLSMMTSIGDYVFVHAGLRPGRPVDQQVEDDVLWIRDEFLEDKSSFEQIVVHGHTPINEPYRDYRRVGIDTGAYLSGKLTAACFVRGEINFLTT